MKLPSITYLISTSKESFSRFPITILCALISVCLSIYLIETGEDLENPYPLINILLTSALGIPLFFCTSIYISKNNLTSKFKIFSISFAISLLVLIYFSLPNLYSTHNTSLPYIRYAIFNIIIHLLVSFSPYIKSRSLNGFWNYNKILFLRFCTSILFSGVLYLGIILALVTVAELFGVNIHAELYGEIWVIIAGLFNTWFFISGIPKDLDQLDTIDKYPKGLKIFSQYILLPLLIIYLVILYLYGGKIILEWDWPKGLVSWLISIVATLGILTLLLIYPYGNQKENAWIKKFTSIYYYALFPLIILLFIAIWMRVSEYGITINRYIIILLGFWLTIVSIYFSIKKTNIKFIPVSLALLLFLMSFGPWGMFSLSEQNQIKRLKNILSENFMLIDGKLANEVKLNTDTSYEYLSIRNTPNDSLLSDSLNNEVKSILDYLDDHHGFSGIRSFYQQNIDSLVRNKTKKNNKNEGKFDYDPYLNEAKIYMSAMGLDYYYYYPYNENTYYHYTSNYKEKAIEIEHYDLLFVFNRLTNTDRNFTVDSVEHLLNFENNLITINVKSIIKPAYFDLSNLMSNLINKYDKSPSGYKSNIPIEEMSLYANNDQYQYKLIINDINIYSNTNSSSLDISNIEYYLLINKK